MRRLAGYKPTRGNLLTPMPPESFELPALLETMITRSEPKVNLHSCQDCWEGRGVSLCTKFKVNIEDMRSQTHLQRGRQAVLLRFGL